MNTLIKSMEAEFRRYKTMAEGALSQVAEPQLSAPGPGNGNSLVIICRHIAGNLRSRFTEFLTSDGEKPWRHREEEFAAREVSREGLLAEWKAGWGALPPTPRPPPHPRRPHRCRAGAGRHHSRSAPRRARGPAPLSRASELPRGPDRLPGALPVRTRLAVPQHPAGRVGGIQRKPGL